MSLKLQLYTVLIGNLVINQVTLAMQQSMQVYYGCEQNFQFETKNNAARCIQQERLSFKPPQSCSRLGGLYKDYRLIVDHQGNKDLCVLPAGVQPQLRSSSIAPHCATGYNLLTQSDRDSCILKKPEVIKAPTMKVRLN